MPETQSLTLIIRGLQIPSKKNRHYAAAKGRLLIDKETAERVETITQLLVLKCLSESQTIAKEILMGCSPLYSIVSLIPEEDSLQWIPRMEISVEKVEVGEEGAVIEITRL